MPSLLWMLLACWGENAHIVEGTVVQVTAADEVVIDHQEIEGFMDAMIMPFHVKDPDLIDDLEPGDRVIARLEIQPSGGYLTKIRVTGKGPVPNWRAADGPTPLRVGQVLPSTEVTLSDGTKTIVGRGQDRPTALTFLYTRCPMPEFCPATVARFQALQEAVGPDVRLLAITLDPAYDTEAVLTAFAVQSSADPAIWAFGRVEDFDDLAMYARLSVVRESPDSIEIAHGNRMLVFDASGTLVERYEDHSWPIERVVKQLRTGAPLGL